MSGTALIRPARRDDVAVLLAMIGELAAYERAADRAVGTPELLSEALFGARPTAEAVIAEVGSDAAGFALFYPTFSTWLCRPGVWLEDLYVSPTHRGAGLGRALLLEVARRAVERGCGRLEWSALDWNAPALGFYAALGAARLPEWHLHRLEGPALQRLATTDISRP